MRKKLILCIEAQDMPQAVNLQHAIQRFITAAMTANGNMATIDAAGTVLASAIWDAQARVHDSSIVTNRDPKER